MSLTRSRLEELHDDRCRTVALGGPPELTPLRTWLTEEGTVPRGWPKRLGLAWIAALTAAVALEPAPAADASEPLWASALFLAMMAALVGMAAGLARRQRLGLVAAAAAGGLALVAAVMCPVSGHHGGVGAWWFLQMGGFTALVAASLAGLRRSRSDPPSVPAAG